MLESLIFKKIQFRRISVFLTSCLPEEGCGLLAGSTDGVVQKFFTITNKLHNSTRFRMDEIELVHALHDLESNQQVLLGIFHSHPTGPDHPSITDLAEYYYPDSLMVIFSRVKRGWKGSAFQIKLVEQSYRSISIIRI